MRFLARCFTFGAMGKIHLRDFVLWSMAAKKKGKKRLHRYRVFRFLKNYDFPKPIDQVDRVIDQIEGLI